MAAGCGEQVYINDTSRVTCWQESCVRDTMERFAGVQRQHALAMVEVRLQTLPGMVVGMFGRPCRPASRRGVPGGGMPTRPQCRECH